jgi:hypothetical protein
MVTKSSFHNFVIVPYAGLVLLIFWVWVTHVYTTNELASANDLSAATPCQRQLLHQKLSISEASVITRSMLNDAQSVCSDNEHLASTDAAEKRIHESQLHALDPTPILGIATSASGQPDRRAGDSDSAR